MTQIERNISYSQKGRATTINTAPINYKHFSLAYSGRLIF